MRLSDLRFRAARRLARRGLPHEAYTAAGARLLPGRSGFKYFVEADHLDGIDAFARNHELVRQAAERAGVTPFAVNAPADAGVVLGIDRPGVSRLLAGLRALGAETPVVVAVSVIDGPDVSGLAHQVLDGDPGEVFRIRVYANYRERTSDHRYTGGYACTVEVWDEDERGDLVAPTLNARASVISADRRQLDATLDVHGVAVPTFAPMVAPDPFAVDFPVDVVYLWVDGADPEWQARKAARQREQGIPDDAEAVHAVRFDQGDELRFSLRSLHRYAPWVRRIFLVTDRQRPDWLVEEPGRLDVVDHTEILPASALPTFNSHAITGAVHHIEGLSDRFLVLNDDVLFGRPVSPEQFFLSNGTSKFFTSRAALPAVVPGSPEEPLFAARRRSQEVVRDLTGMQPLFGFKHTPIAFDRELLTELEEEVPAWRSTLASPFRSGTDIVPEWIHHYVGYHRRRTYPSGINYAYFDIGDRRAVKLLWRRVRKNRPSVLCVNDVTEDLVEGASRHDALHAILEAMLPRPSPFEQPSSGRVAPWSDGTL